MAAFDYKSSYAWQEAIELIPKVNRLSEDLPAADQDSMGGELRRTVIDLATAVAVDLIAASKPRFDYAIRLETQLEVIRRVYPALDTVIVEQDLSKLLERLQSDQFTAVKTAPTSQAEATPGIDSSSAAEPNDDPDQLTESDSDSNVEPVNPSTTQISVNSDSSN